MWPLVWNPLGKVRIYIFLKIPLTFYNAQQFLMKFAIFGLSASVDIRPLPDAWVAELLGVVLGVQDHKKMKFPTSNIAGHEALKGLNHK